MCTLFEQDIALYVHPILLAISYHHSWPDSTAWGRDTAGREEEEEEGEDLAIVPCFALIKWLYKSSRFILSTGKLSEFICCLLFTVCLNCGAFVVCAQVTLLLFSDILLLLKKSGRSLLTLESPLTLEHLIVSEESCEGMFLFFSTHTCIHTLHSLIVILALTHISCTLQSFTCAIITNLVSTVCCAQKMISPKFCSFIILFQI